MAVAVGEPAAAVVGSSRGGMDVGKFQNTASTSNGVSPVWEMKEESQAVKKTESGWNTKRLGSRMAADAACAMTAGGLVAPIITMIDK